MVRRIRHERVNSRCVVAAGRSWQKRPISYFVKLDVISQERLRIEVKLLLSANRKSYIPVPRRLAQQRMTFSDLEWPFDASRTISAVACRAVWWFTKSWRFNPSASIEPSSVVYFRRAMYIRECAFWCRYRKHRQQTVPSSSSCCCAKPTSAAASLAQSKWRITGRRLAVLSGKRSVSPVMIL